MHSRRWVTLRVNSFEKLAQALIQARIEQVVRARGLEVRMQSVVSGRRN